MIDLPQIALFAGQAVVFVSIAYLLIYCNKRGSDWYAKKKGFCADDAIEEDNNLAVALRRAGLYGGLALAFHGVISGPSNGFVNDIISIASFGVIVSVFFVFARAFNDFAVLGTMDNTEEVKNGNVAVGLVEFGAFIATGLIARASMLGDGGGYLTAVAFFAIGQVLLLLVAVGYEAIVSYSIRDEIKKGNPAAGLRLGGLMVALAVGINSAVAYDFVSWVYNLTYLFIDGGIVVLMMFASSVVVDRFFLSGTDIKTEIVRDQSVSAILIVVAMNIAAALVVSASLI